MSLTIESLCTGYAGLDLAVCSVFDARLQGVADTDPAAAMVLDARLPGVANRGDIADINWDGVQADIITAGYPCQPFSYAGRRKGNTDERHLWPHVAEAIRRVRPRWVVLENVPGHRSMGLGAVLGELARDGYMGAWCSIRSSDVGAPHQRERLFILATDANAQSLRHQRSGQTWNGRARSEDSSRPTANTDSPRLERCRDELTQRRGELPTRASRVAIRQRIEWGKYSHAIRRWERTIGREAPPPTELSKMGNAQLSARFSEWMMGLADGWVTGVDGLTRRDMIRLCGNGVVPQQGAHALRSMLPLLDSQAESLAAYGD